MVRVVGGASLFGWDKWLERVRARWLARMRDVVVKRRGSVMEDKEVRLRQDLRELECEESHASLMDTSMVVMSASYIDVQDADSPSP